MILFFQVQLRLEGEPTLNARVCVGLKRHDDGGGSFSIDPETDSLR